jgi:uncharacterized surface protein with fasciclin (FAS1) repeats
MMFRIVMGVLILASLITGGVLAQDSEATVEPTPLSDTAYVRVANFAASADSVDIALDAENGAFPGFTFQQIGDWTAVPTGTYNVTAGEATAEVGLEAGTWTTLAVVESSEAEGTLTVQAIPEVYDVMTPGTAGFTVVHAANGTPALNMLRDEVVFVSGIDYLGVPAQPAFASLNVDSGTFDIAFEEPEIPGETVVDLPQLDFPENAHVLIALVHDGGQPRALIDVTTPAEVAMVTGVLEEPGTLMDAAQANEHLVGLREALDEAGLTEQFSGDAPFTIFAPADFVLDDAAANDPEALANLLRAHTVEGEMTLQDIMEAETLTTLAGSDLQVHVEGDTIFVNDAQVIEANIPATNGVIHMLNGLVTPEDAS